MTGLDDVGSISVLHVTPGGERDRVARRLEDADAAVDVRTVAWDDSVRSVLDTDRVDCVVATHDPPAVDGFDVLERARERWPDRPVVLYAAGDASVDASDALAAGADDVVERQNGDARVDVLAARVRTTVRASRYANERRDDHDVRRDDHDVRRDDHDVRRDDHDEDEVQDEHRLGRRAGFAASLLDALEDPFFVFEVGGGLVYWNDQLEDATGYDVATLDGAPPTLFVPDEYRQRARADAQRIRAGEDVRYDGEIETVDGDRIPYEFHVASHEGADGTTYGVGFAQDISERVEREKRVRERTEQLETILQHFPVIAFTLDADGTFTRSVGAGLESLGVAPGELVGASIYDVYGYDDEIVDNFERALDGEATASTVTVEGVTFESRYVPVVDDGEVTQVVGVAFDVTDRVEQREALEAKNERLEEFASVLSHDLRNPLSVASGTLEVLAEHVVHDDDDVDHDAEVEESVTTIRTAHERMARIVDDVLALARGDGDVETAPVAAGAVATQAVSTVETNDVNVSVDYDATVMADGSALARVVENLVRNAVEHGGETVVVGSLADDDGFYVADDGSGVPGDLEDSIFEAGVTSSTDGTGLGLAIVSDIATAHDWTVTATEDPDLGGARFEVRGVDPA